MIDYFEIDRLIENLAKLYSTACAISWFKVNNVDKPTPTEFRNKVVEFMKHFEFTLSTFPNNEESDKFRKYAKNLLITEINLILEGKNKEVERRYKYYVDYR